MPSVIALDAMGSDRAPKPEIEGAILAARQYDVAVVLVGPEDRLRAELRQHEAAAGHTGAAMATAKMVLGALPGVDRPALAAVFPTAAGTAAVLLDVGANVDCKPENLEQFAIMGEIYFRSIFGTERPRVGLLSI